ncbi:unnamed protein product [Phytomonas sp. Hart1]|nr:unnamed protein product [Phytomonas sp. Hart1]|eukprot:CCW66261.1 unnamed protein product [Phytomonas sp. isolate Hart1]
MNVEKNECLICVTEAGKGEALGLSNCKHFFHHECWRTFVRHSLDTNENLWNFRCPMDGCLELVDAQCLKQLFSAHEEAPLRLKIEQHLLQRYVDTSPRLSWCPNEKGCEGIIYTPKALHSREAVECDVCHLHFCFHCKKIPHSPAFCNQVQKWLHKIDEDLPNTAFVLVHTKGCPNCNVRIEKYMGCNHMTCTCGYQFCWMCLGKWSSHAGNYFSCNNAKQGGQGPKDEENEGVKFYKYYEKYMNQQDSSKKENNQLDMLTNHTSDFPQPQPNSYSLPNSPDFLANLLGSVKSALSIARERIAFATVRSYYSDSDKNETRLFLYRMGSLEEATENLSHQLSTLNHITLINVKELQKG